MSSPRHPQRRSLRSILLACVSLTASACLTACGADDRLAPYTPPPPACPEADEYLRPLYELEAQGRIANLAYVVRERVPDDARRDLIDALLGLMAAFEDGDFSALERAPRDPSAPPGSGLQATLGKILRWLSETGPSAPNLPLVRVLRGALATCEGGPVFRLLADAVSDKALVTALLDTLASDALRAGVAGLDFEGDNGREAMRYLVRNLLVSATSDAFDVDTLVDLLGLLVDLDAPPYSDLVGGLERLLDADGLEALQDLLVCLQRVDPDLALGAFLYDFLTANLLADVIPDKAPELSDATLELAQKALRALADGPEIRRGLVPALLVFLADDTAPPVLRDLASLFESGALSGVIDLVSELAKRTCRDGGAP